MSEIIPRRSDPSPATSAGRRLARLLSPLSALFAGREAGPATEAEAGAIAGVRAWADSDYTYFEARLPGAEGREIDLTIHNGRVYVRVARGTEDFCPLVGDPEEQ